MGFQTRASLAHSLHDPAAETRGSVSTRQADVTAAVGMHPQR
jgi:hypothetical protein